MFDRDLWSEIFNSIKKNKMRTFLTGFSVAWGIFILVLLLGSVNGLQNGFAKQFNDDASNAIFIYPNVTKKPYGGFDAGRRIIFKNKDVEYIKGSFEDSYEYISARYNKFLNIKYKKAKASFPIRAVHPDHQYIEKTIIDEGRFLNDQDLEKKAKVVVLGKKVVEELFDKEKALGANVEINGFIYKVIGIFSDEGNEREERNVYAPISTFQSVYSNTDHVDQIIVTYNPKFTFAEAINFSDVLETVFKRRLIIDPEDQGAIYLNNMAEGFSDVSNFTFMLTVISVAIGFLILVAGIVGIGNIMVFIIKERTKEIGIRKALGARPAEVIRLVILESIFITAISGIAGLLFGTGLLALLRPFLDFPGFSNPSVDSSTMGGLLDRDLWNEVFSTLSKNILRTLLTTLGVIFAIVILLLLLGTTTGMKNGFDKIFAGTATNSMFMWTQVTSMPYKGFEKGRDIDFELSDVELIKSKVKEVDVIAPRIQLGNFRSTTTVLRNGLSSGSSVYGDYPSIDKISKKRLIEGRFLNSNDLNQSKKVCVIGQDTYKLLFKKGEKAIGEYIQINGVYFAVVGVYMKPKNIDFDGENAVFIPFTTFQKAFNSGDEVGWFAISVKPEYTVKLALSKIKTLLKAKYKVHPDDPRAIGAFDFSEIFTGISGFTIALQVFSFFVGTFTLLAGVISVSNILLITVKERTKEIGVRRALGATPKIIKRQIILESIILTTFAALIGFVVSILILYVIDVKYGGTGDFPFDNPIVNFTQLFVTFSLMIGLSVIIGMIPARRAVKIKPIEALREE